MNGVPALARPDPSAVDVLVPTCGRPAALAVTLTALRGQTHRPARVVVSDQGDDDVFADPVVVAVLRVLEVAGVTVERHRHLPRRGLAEHRQFLLERGESPLVLFLDDDVICEPEVLARLVAALHREGCGQLGRHEGGRHDEAEAGPGAHPGGAVGQRW